MPDIKRSSITNLTLALCFRDHPDNRRSCSSLVTQFQQGWRETLPSSSMSLLCSFYPLGFHQEAQLETWLLSKEIAFPCSCGPSGTLYPTLWAEKLLWPGLRHIPLFLWPAWPEVDSILVASGWKDWLLISLQLLPAVNLICSIPCLIPPNP